MFPRGSHKSGTANFRRETLHGIISQAAAARAKEGAKNENCKFFARSAPFLQPPADLALPHGRSVSRATSLSTGGSRFSSSTIATHGQDPFISWFSPDPLAAVHSFLIRLSSRSNYPHPSAQTAPVPGCYLSSSAITFLHVRLALHFLLGHHLTLLLAVESFHGGWRIANPLCTRCSGCSRQPHFSSFFQLLPLPCRFFPSTFFLLSAERDRGIACERGTSAAGE